MSLDGVVRIVASSYVLVITRVPRMEFARNIIVQEVIVFAILDMMVLRVVSRKQSAIHHVYMACVLRRRAFVRRDTLVRRVMRSYVLTIALGYVLT